MAAINTGGPAFPQALTVQEEFVGSEGLTLRDYFAAHAIAGVLTIQAGFDVGMDNRALAAACYELADALLAQRERTDDEEVS